LSRGERGKPKDGGEFGKGEGAGQIAVNGKEGGAYSHGGEKRGRWVGGKYGRGGFLLPSN